MIARRLVSAVVLLALTACSGGGGSGPTPSPAPTPTPAPTPPGSGNDAPDFSAVEREIELFSVSDMAVVIGDETGTLYSFSKGGIGADDELAIASASKLVFGLASWQLIEDGTMARGDHPQAYIDYWTTVSGDGRADITLDQLMGFVSGFGLDDASSACVGVGGPSLYDCVREVYAGGVDYVPGTRFTYGSKHMQVAALMVAEATGEAPSDWMRETLFDPVGMSDATYFPDVFGDNPAYAASLRSTANDYALMLTALLKGELVTDWGGFLADRVGNKPGNRVNDWHYGWGFWIECGTMSFQASCVTNPTISSPGQYGFTPWVDFDAGYWAIIAVEETPGTGYQPVDVIRELELDLQPLIVAALSSE